MKEYEVHVEPLGNFYSTGEDAKEAKGKVWNSLTESERDSVASMGAYEAQSGELELWGSDPHCIHWIKFPSGGGIRCRRCGGWFCY